MEANSVKSVASYILKRLKQAPIKIRYKDDPDHTTKKVLPSIVRVRGVKEEELFGSLTALCNEGVVDRELKVHNELKLGSGPDPIKSTYKTVTYSLVG